MLNRKSLIVATAAALTLGAAAIPGQAYANGNDVLGAVVGAGIGAAIGHNVHGHNGALVGSAIGAIAGASIAAQSHYDEGYYAAPDVYAAAPEYYAAPVYYGAAPTYYEPAPVYYPRPQLRYAPRVETVRFVAPHRNDHGRFESHGHQDRRGDGHGHKR